METSRLFGGLFIIVIIEYFVSLLPNEPNRYLVDGPQTGYRSGGILV